MLQVGEFKWEPFHIFIYGFGGRFCVFTPNLEPICRLKSSEVRPALTEVRRRLGAKCHSRVVKRSTVGGVRSWSQRVWKHPSY